MDKYVNIGATEHQPKNRGLFVQLPIWSLEDMHKISKSLVDEIGGYRGIGFCAYFPINKKERVIEYFKSLGFNINEI